MKKTPGALKSPKLLKTSEVAALFKVSNTTVLRWIDLGYIIAVNAPSKHRRILASSVDPYLDGGTGLILTAKEVADRYGVTTMTVGRWAISKRVPSFKTPGGVWRFRENQLPSSKTTATHT